MKLIKFEQTEKFKNGENCEVLEYPLDDKDINISTAVLSGRYPEKGYCVNEQCKELIYVVSGSGTLNKKDEVIEEINQESNENLESFEDKNYNEDEVESERKELIY